MVKYKFLPMVTVFSPLAVYLVLRIFSPEILTLENLLPSLEGLYQDYGILIITIAGLVESIFLLNMFVPGSVVILLGAVLASTGVISLPVVIIVGTLSLVVGYIFDYFVGSFGWYSLISKTQFFGVVKKAEAKIKQHEEIVTFISGFNPNAAAVIALASGILKIDFRKFVFRIFFTQLFWSTFWGILFYSFGVALLDNAVYVVLAAITIIITMNIFWSKFSSQEVEK